jgi:hypothetical protein
MTGPSFEAVLAAAGGGDELAFGILWRDLQPGDERAFRAWVFTVARHRAVDRWRRSTRRSDELVPTDALVHLPAPDDPASSAVDAISSRAAVALIATLPHDQAEVPPSPAAGRRACPRPVSGRPLAMAAG